MLWHVVLSFIHDLIDNLLPIFIRCYNAETEFKFTFISFIMGLKGREGGCHPSSFFFLCSDVILEIYSLVHLIPSAPWQM